GTLTAHLQVPGLRVGDLVDVAFLHDEQPLLAGSTRAGRVVMEFGVPVALTRHVVHWPSAWPLNLAEVPDRVTHQIRSAGETQRHEWRREGHLPPPDEDQAAVDDDPTAVVRYSAWSDWAPLAAALAPHYRAGYTLPPQWLDRVDEIRASTGDDLARATRALRLVQDEIR